VKEPYAARIRFRTVAHGNSSLPGVGPLPAPGPSQVAALNLMDATSNEGRAAGWAQSVRPAATTAARRKMPLMPEP
jgi:hypothetical protein